MDKFLVLLFHMMGFSMLPSAMNRPFSYPEDYISDPDSNLILVTRLCSYIRFGLSRLRILFPEWKFGPAKLIRNMQRTKWRRPC